MHLNAKILSNQTGSLVAQSDFFGDDAQAQCDAWSQPFGPFGADQANALTVTDLTASDAAGSAITEGLGFREVGARAIAVFIATNKTKGVTGEQFISMASNPKLLLAMQLVDWGALKEGRDLFVANVGDLYTADEVAAIVKPINDSGLV